MLAVAASVVARVFAAAADMESRNFGMGCDVVMPVGAGFERGKLEDNISSSGKKSKLADSDGCAVVPAV